MAMQIDFRKKPNLLKRKIIFHASNSLSLFSSSQQVKFGLNAECDSGFEASFCCLVSASVIKRVMTTIAPLQIKQLNALTDFALYAGVGRKTPMGMGMVRRL